MVGWLRFEGPVEDGGVELVGYRERVRYNPSCNAAHLGLRIVEDTWVEGEWEWSAEGIEMHGMGCRFIIPRATSVAAMLIQQGEPNLGGFQSTMVSVQGEILCCKMDELRLAR